MNKPSIGRIVHYVLSQGPAKGEHRPAIIVKVWPEGGVGLQIFTHSDRDGNYGDEHFPMEWEPVVNFDEVEKAPGTCHWPEKEAA